MAHLSDLRWDFLRGNNISEFNLGRLVWRRGSQWGGGGARVSNFGRFSVLST